MVPLLIIITFSVLSPAPDGGVAWEFTLSHYNEALSPMYLNVFLRSVAYAGVATAITLFLGYPTAYFMAFSGPVIRGLIMFLIVLPLWTNLLVELYALIILFGNSGLINLVLTRIGIIDKPLPLLNNRFSVLAGLVYWNLPYMILPIYTCLAKMDVSLYEASMDPGGDRFQTFMRIVLPVSLPGVVTGLVFCFIPSLGNFFVPEVLGGPSDYMIGNIITFQFLGARNWPFGSALASLLLLVILVFVAAYIRYSKDPLSAAGDRGA